MKLFVGIGLLVGGLLLTRRSVRPFGMLPAQRSPYFKPGPAFLLALGCLAVAGIGLAIIFNESLTAGVLASLAIVALWINTRFWGSEEATRRTMAKSYQRYRSAIPDAEESEVLFRTLRSRYPRWPEKELRAAVVEYPNLPTLTEAVLVRDRHKLTADQMISLGVLSTRQSQKDNHDARQG